MMLARAPGLCAGAVIACLAIVSPAAAQHSIPETLVMPFDNGGDVRLHWLGEGSALLLSEYLGRYGAATVAREERLAAFERLQLPPAAALSHATVIKVGQLAGAADVVIGTYELAADQLTVRARLIRLGEGRLLPEVTERGPSQELFAIFDRVARRLRGAASPAPPPAPGTLLTSAVAFEAFAKGLVADNAVTQQQFLEQALKAAPADDRIRLALWHVHSDAGDHLRALDVVAAVRPASPHASTARYLAARSQIELKRYDVAFDGLKALEQDARSPVVLNALGVVQLRRGSSPQTGRAVYYFNQAAQGDPADADYLFNLGYAYWIDRDPPAAIYWLREAVRRDPTDGDAHYILGAALHQTGATAEAQRELELAQRLSASYEAPAAGEPVLRGLERLKPYLDSARRVDAVLASAGQRDQADLATFHLDAGRRAFDREADREAESELRRALYLSPYLAEAHLLLGRLHLRQGRVAEAIQSLKIGLWSEPSAAAHVALAEAYLQSQNIPAAREEVERALSLDPDNPAAQALRARIGQ